MSYFNPATGQWENPQPPAGGGFPAPNQPPGGFPAPNQPPGGFPAPNQPPGGFPAPNQPPQNFNQQFQNPPQGYPQQPQQPQMTAQQAQEAIAAAIAGAEAGGGERLPNLPLGQHIVVVEDLKFFRGRDGDDFFLANMRVEATNSMETPAGTRVSYLQKLSGKSRDAGLGSTKRFLLACCGFVNPSKEEEAMLTAPQISAATSELQPFAGRRLECTAYTHMRKSGEPMVAYNWRPAA